jgi:hypothetical protein
VLALDASIELPGVGYVMPAPADPMDTSGAIQCAVIRQTGWAGVERTKRKAARNRSRRRAGNRLQLVAVGHPDGHPQDGPAIPFGADGQPPGTEASCAANAVRSRQRFRRRPPRPEAFASSERCFA